MYSARFSYFFAGIFTMVYNLKSALTNFEYVLGNMSFVFLVIVPILTMRVLAEERRQKTDQLLYSLPLTMTKVVLGKYAAMLMMLLSQSIVCLYPLILSSFGHVYLPASFSAIAGFFFLGAALLAIGMFISSVTDSQAVAAGLCFVAMLLNYYISSLASYVSTSSFASFAAFTILILVLAVIIRLMTKSSFAALLVGIVLEAALLLWYLFHSTGSKGCSPR